MDYLVVEGYKEAAENFAREAGMSPVPDFESIQNRMTVRNAIQRGDIVEAIERVNDLNPEVSITLFLGSRRTRSAACSRAPEYTKIINTMHHSQRSLDSEGVASAMLEGCQRSEEDKKGHNQIIVMYESIPIAHSSSTFTPRLAAKLRA